MIIAKQQDKSKDVLIYLLKDKTRIDEKWLNKFKDESLQYIYNCIRDKKTRICKTRIDKNGVRVRIYIPKSMREKLDLEYGDRFNVRVNVKLNEVTLIKEDGGKYKMTKDNSVYLPLKVSHYLKMNEEALVVLRNGKIVYKSFSYF